MPDRVEKKIRSPACACCFLKSGKEPRLIGRVTAMQIAIGHFHNAGILEKRLPSIIAADDERVILQENGRDMPRIDFMHGLFDKPTGRTILE